MINWSRVAELRDEIGAEDFDEVVELFLEEVEEVIERLRGLTDRSSLEPDLHFLKGSALNLGFADLSDVCAAGEKMAAGGNSDEVNVDQVISTFAGSKTQFLSDLQTQLA